MWPGSLFSKYKDKGAIIDSNLLLLYFVGKYETRLISKYKRTRIYTVDDFLLIQRVFQYFYRVLTTPHILTEVSNLSTQLPGSSQKAYFAQFSKEVTLLEEEYIQSGTVCVEDYFPSLGLTDAAIAFLARGKYLVFTDDLRMAGILGKMAVDVVNINHLRSIRWFGI